MKFRSLPHAASVLKKSEPGSPEAKAAASFFNSRRGGEAFTLQHVDVRTVRRELKARLKAGRDAYIVRNLIVPPFVVIEGDEQLMLYLWVRGIAKRWQLLLYKARLLAHRRDETRMQRKRFDPMPGSAYPMNGIRRG